MQHYLPGASFMKCPRRYAYVIAFLLWQLRLCACAAKGVNACLTSKPRYCKWKSAMRTWQESRQREHINPQQQRVQTGTQILRAETGAQRKNLYQAAGRK